MRIDAGKIYASRCGCVVIMKHCGGRLGPYQYLYGKRLFACSPGHVEAGTAFDIDSGLYTMAELDPGQPLHLVREIEP